jgi:hypothetical protein
VTLRDHAPTANDLDEDGGGLGADLEAIQEEEEPMGPITAQQKGFKNSIFVTDEERNKLDAWMKSQYKRKAKPQRGRRNSVSSVSRSRTNTNQWDTSAHPAGFDTRGRATSRASDEAAGTTSFSPAPRKRTVSGERGETYNALLAAAAVDGTASTAGAGEAAAVDGSRPVGSDKGTSAGDIEITQVGTLKLPSLTHSDEFPVQPESPDYSNQTWEEWFYEPNKVGIYEEAAVLIQGALDAEDPELFTSRRGLWCFQQRTKLSALFKGAAVLYSLLKLVQRPVWTYSEPEWNNPEYFPTSGMPQWSPYVTGGIKIPLLLIIMYGMLLEVGQQEASFTSMVFRKHSLLGIARHVLQLYAIVQFCLVLYSLSGGPEVLVPYTSCGSMLYVLWFVRRSLRKLHMVLQVVPRLCAVLGLYFLIIFLFAGFGPFLYPIANVGEDDDVAREYYSNFRTATWSIFVAITSSSYPCQIMPAYRQYREFSLFFFLFITIGALFMLNLIVSIVFVEFRRRRS